MQVDYNGYVDEILHVSHAYNVGKSDPLGEITTNPDILRVYHAFKRQEPIYVNQNLTINVSELNGEVPAQ